MAGDLVRDHGEEEIRAQVEQLDWLVETKPGKVADPAAWLVAAIRNGHAAPKGFVSKAERQRREEARQAQEREKAEQRRRQREQEARDRAIREEVDAYLKRLTPAERKALEAEVLARADPEARQGYEEAPARLRATMLLGLLREHVAQELGREAIPSLARRTRPHCFGTRPGTRVHDGTIASGWAQSAPVAPPGEPSRRTLLHQGPRPPPQLPEPLATRPGLVVLEPPPQEIPGRGVVAQELEFGVLLGEMDQLAGVRGDDLGAAVGLPCWRGVFDHIVHVRDRPEDRGGDDPLERFFSSPTSFLHPATGSPNRSHRSSHPCHRSRSSESRSPCTASSASTPPASRAIRIGAAAPARPPRGRGGSGRRPS